MIDGQTLLDDNLRTKDHLGLSKHLCNAHLRLKSSFTAVPGPLSTVNPNQLWKPSVQEEILKYRETQRSTPWLAICSTEPGILILPRSGRQDQSLATPSMNPTNARVRGRSQHSPQTYHEYTSQGSNLQNQQSILISHLEKGPSRATDPLRGISML